MTGDDFIALAGKLIVVRSNDPASIRTSIGRCYYGAFHLVLALLEELQIPNIGRKHDLDQYLNVSGETAARQAGRLLNNLGEYRRKADYELDDREVEDFEVARGCVERAHRLRSLIEQCRQEPVRSAIRNNVIAWKAKTRGDR